MEQTMAMRATHQRGEQPRWSLTTAQAGIWFAQQKYPQSPACNTGEYWLLEGALAPHHFTRAVRQTIDEIPGLHCAFVATADGPQMVANPACWQLAERDLRSEADPLAAAQVEMRAQLAVPFNLAGGAAVCHHPLSPWRGAVGLVYCRAPYRHRRLWLEFALPAGGKLV
ncbi:condensation domain-containing protein [Aeromonas veronii]|uniref:condensation domain-containing protein n=1 Tax=Aeromonas veronii TaxID=654 RepID=UPI0024439647|nr:condensation domain-containing protein [Aeromonas veronii]